MFTLYRRARISLVLLALSGCVAPQNDCDSARYNPPESVNISRPISVLVVDDMPSIDGCAGQWACAANAFGQGRAIIYLKRGREACLYHELAHVGGWNHD